MTHFIPFIITKSESSVMRVKARVKQYLTDEAAILTQKSVQFQHVQTAVYSKHMV